MSDRKLPKQVLNPSDFAVMDRMAKANMDIAFFPDILQMKAVKKGSQILVGASNDAMQKLARGYTGVGPAYFAALLVLDQEQFTRVKDSMVEEGGPVLVAFSEEVVERLGAEAYPYDRSGQHFKKGQAHRRMGYKKALRYANTQAVTIDQLIALVKDCSSCSWCAGQGSIEEEPCGECRGSGLAIPDLTALRERFNTLPCKST